MNRLHLSGTRAAHALACTTVALSLAAFGCGHAAVNHGAGAPEAAARTALAHTTAAPAADDATETARAEDGAAASGRAAGDFIVYKFSGTFRKAPLTLTQRVVSREGASITVDVTLEGAGKTTALRVRMSDAPSTRGEVESVRRLENGAERDAGIEVYEALMAEVALAADQNEELLGTEDRTVDVGGAALAVKQTSYRVKVGKQKATLKTLERDGFAWGDLGGEITAKDGTVLYKAEVVDMGGAAAPTKIETVATSTYDE